MDRSGEKIAYTPSENKRFEISPDPFSRERVQALHAAYNQLRAEIPDVSIAFTLGGSLAKGKVLTEETAKAADIDLHYFIDKDELHAHAPEVASLASSLTGRSFGSDEKGGKRAAAGLVERALNRPLQDGSNLLAHCERFYVDLLRGSASFIDDHTIFDKVTLHREELKNWDFYYLRVTPKLIGQYFSLDIGGGMRKYIQSFLRQLEMQDAKVPGDAEALWQTTRKAVEKYERGDVIPSNVIRQFPQTYEDACKYYGLRRKGLGTSQDEAGRVE